MSQTSKTWDGLRVWTPLWYPRNPQDYLRGIPDRMAVYDARPRPADVYYTLPFGMGTFCLTSPTGIDWTFAVEDDGALVAHQETWGRAQRTLEMAEHIFYVDDDGALHLRNKPIIRPDNPWKIASLTGIEFEMTVASDHAVLLTIVAGPAYMEGVFTLISPNGTSYVVYIVDDMAVLVRPGNWGPASTTFYLDTWKMVVDNAGSLIVSPSGEAYPEQYRMVSTGGYEYMWTVDPDGAVKIGREGHFWDVPVTVLSKPTRADGFPGSMFDTTDQVTEDGQHRWIEE